MITSKGAVLVGTLAVFCSGALWGYWGLDRKGFVMAVLGLIQRVARPLASRKVRVAMATVVAVYAAEFGLGVNEEVVATLLGVGVAVILGIAIEDAGQKSAGGRR